MNGVHIILESLLFPKLYVDIKNSPVIENIQIPKYFYFLVNNFYHLISVSKYKFQTLSHTNTHIHTHTYTPGERWRERYMYIEQSHTETDTYTL